MFDVVETLFQGRVRRISADRRTNTLIVVGLPPICEEVEAILVRLDTAPARPRPTQAKTMSLPGTPAAKELGERLAAQEAAAASVASEIRRLQANGDAVEPIATHQAQLKTHLQAAFEFKMQLEELQVKELHSRLSRLERQIGQRKELREQIIARRIAELLNPDASWDAATGTPNASAHDPSMTSGKSRDEPRFNRENVEQQSAKLQAKRADTATANNADKTVSDWGTLLTKIRPQDWGAPNQGLRLAVAPASENTAADKALEVLVVVKNESEHDVTFNDTGWYGDIKCTIRQTSGAQVGTQLTAKSGRSRPRTMTLAAGQSMVIGVRKIRVTDQTILDDTETDVVIVDSKAFEFRNVVYTISCDVRAQLADQVEPMIPLHSGTVAIAFSRPEPDAAPRTSERRE